MCYTSYPEVGKSHCRIENDSNCKDAEDKKARGKGEREGDAKSYLSPRSPRLCGAKFRY
jgi:hypothetical protein